MLAASNLWSALLPATYERGQVKAEVLSKSLNLWDGSVAVAERKMPSDLCSGVSWLLSRFEKLLMNVVPTDLSC